MIYQADALTIWASLKSSRSTFLNTIRFLRMISGGVKASQTGQTSEKHNQDIQGTAYLLSPGIIVTTTCLTLALVPGRLR